MEENILNYSDRGVKLFVTSRPTNCDIELVIPNQLIHDYHELALEKRNKFKLNLFFYCKKEKYPEGLKIYLNELQYPRDDYGILCSKQSIFKIDLDCNDYDGTLILYPHSYLTNSHIGEIRKDRRYCKNAVSKKTKIVKFPNKI